MKSLLIPRSGPTGPLPQVPWVLSSPLHLFGMIFLTLALPISLLGLWIADRARESLLEAATVECSLETSLASQLVLEHLEGLKRLVDSVAQRSRLQKAVKEHDMVEARDQFRDLLELSPAFDRFYITDIEGTEWVNYPADPENLGKNFAERDWFRNIRGHAEPYVSQVYYRSGSPQAQVVAVAAPVPGPDGKGTIGYLVAQSLTRTMTSWLNRPRRAEVGSLTLLDQSDHLVASSLSRGGEATITNLVNTELAPLLRSSERGTRIATGPLNDSVGSVTGPCLVGYHAVGDLGWKMMVTRPLAQIVGPAKRLEWIILLSAGGCFLVMFLLASSWLDIIRRFHSLLTESMAKLARSNVELSQLTADLDVTTASAQKAHEELQRTEAQLVQAEKLSSLGRLVAGVAHELNNPLAYVSNNVAVLQRDVGCLDKLIRLYQQAEATLADHRQSLIEQIHQLADEIDLPYVLENTPAVMARSREGLARIQNIVKDLRDFARLDETELEVVNLVDGIRTTLPIIRHLIEGKNIDLITDLVPLPSVTCFPTKISQVVLNLVTNAIDACGPGGKITVACRPDRNGVVLSVTDTGHGIDLSIQSKIFDPFFTTKPVGQGTGLGLSISYGIVQAHGGRIDVVSRPGEGSRFTVYLPLRPGSSLSAELTAAHEASPTRSLG